MSLRNVNSFEEGKGNCLPETGSNTGSGQSKGNEDETFLNSKAVCFVCKHFYRDPKILPCLHTFCAECIRQLEPFSVLGTNGKTVLPEELCFRDQNSVTVLCPECDSEVDLPSSGVEGLTIDHLALDEVFFETLLSENFKLVCDLCNEGDAENRCDMCSVSLCEFCSLAHRRQKKTASHVVMCLQQLKTMGRLSRPKLCFLHPGEKLQFFCEPCDLPVCRECAITSHRGHCCSHTHDVVDRHASHLQQLVIALQPRMDQLEEALRQVECSQNSLQTHAEAVAKEVRVFAQGYVQAIEAHCQALLLQLEDIRLRRRNQLHLQAAQLRQALADTRAGINFAQSLLISGSETGILSARGVTARRLERLTEEGSRFNLPPITAAEVCSICFLPEESSGQKGAYPMVGVIHAKTVDPSKCVIQVEGHQEGREGQRCEFTMLCRDTSGEPLGKGGENVQVSIVHNERKECTVEPKVVDNDDGSYTVLYTPVEPGTYSAWVCVKDQHVKGSPFILTVRRKFRRHRGMFHCCSFCSSGGAKDARCGCAGTMSGGYQGCGHGHKGHPGKAHWSCCGSTMEGSECLGDSVRTCSPRSLLRTVDL